MTHGIWAVVPMKGGPGGKQRLAPALTPDERQRLAMAMFEDVLSALHDAPGLAGIAVVTADASVAALAARYGARILGNDATEGHTAAVLGAGRVLGGEGCAGLLALPGDIPMVTPDEIAAVLAAHGAAPCFTIVPSHDEMGSNGVLASPPGVVPLRYGDDSYRPHLEAARRLGVPCRTLKLRGIGLDIDHPQDLDAFLAIPSGTRARRVLESIGYRGAQPAAAG
ncbi:2-phospho-L-lactate guanylyltransferase [Roseomonas sp. NAR14]|uniref:3-phospho-D-glycerate guanylyltransferase n=1 Tax=Roseomonas acroporae TaxID=2937791 RepID=A0A9X2BW60_9PROT|nr:2-phospho-L-lactate guanylyltransferase [Roseomonas acroporae]MCK8785681.1 2-phospho-L-lactate guanylyltransferase [Roseomonas acroporae]